MSKQLLPSENSDDIESRLNAIQEKFASASEQIGYAAKTISSGKLYWKSADRAFTEGVADEILASGYRILESFNEQVRYLDEESEGIISQVY